MNLNYRRFRPDDLPWLLRLWESDSGWGPIAEETWRQWYEDTPLGPCTVVVAEDEQGGMAGQFVLAPVRVVAGDRLLRAHRMTAPILRHDLRTGTFASGDHPMNGLIQRGFEAAAQEGGQVLFSLPHERWMRALHWLEQSQWDCMFTSTFQCLAASVGTPSCSPAGRTDVASVTQFGDGYMELWNAARTGLPIACAAVRDPAWLQWKNGGHLCLEVREASSAQILGFVAIRRQDGLLVDGLARRAVDLPDVLSSALGWLDRTPEARITQVRAMGHPVWEPALRAVGFESIDFSFSLLVLRLDDAVPAGMVDSRQWYVLAGD